MHPFLLTPVPSDACSAATACICSWSWPDKLALQVSLAAAAFGACMRVGQLWAYRSACHGVHVLGYSALGAVEGIVLLPTSFYPGLAAIFLEWRAHSYLVTLLGEAREGPAPTWDGCILVGADAHLPLPGQGQGMWRASQPRSFMLAPTTLARNHPRPCHTPLQCAPTPRPRRQAAGAHWWRRVSLSPASPWQAHHAVPLHVARGPRCADGRCQGGSSWAVRWCR